MWKYTIEISSKARRELQKHYKLGYTGNHKIITYFPIVSLIIHFL